jgi:hypothetical protein
VTSKVKKAGLGSHPGLCLRFLNLFKIPSSASTSGSYL